MKIFNYIAVFFIVTIISLNAHSQNDLYGSWYSIENIDTINQDLDYIEFYFDENKFCILSLDIGYQGVISYELEDNQCKVGGRVYFSYEKYPDSLRIFFPEKTESMMYKLEEKLDVINTSPDSTMIANHLEKLWMRYDSLWVQIFEHH